MHFSDSCLHFLKSAKSMKNQLLAGLYLEGGDIFGKYVMQCLWDCKLNFTYEDTHNKPQNYKCINLNRTIHTHSLLSQKNYSKDFQQQYFQLY
jgi:hypothetical protein